METGRPKLLQSARNVGAGCDPCGFQACPSRAGKWEKTGRNRSGEARRGGEKGKTKRKGGRLKAGRENKGEGWDEG